MRPTVAVSVCGLTTLLLAPAAGAQTSGLPPEWEVRKMLSDLAGRVKRLPPVLDQVKPQDWVSQGAPAAYVEQGKRVRAEIEYLLYSTQKLSQEPERLSAALEAYFRMQTADALLRSYEAGIRKYQNAALADLLQSMLTETAADREKLRQYIVELAADKEQQFKVVDQEAQRCRGMLSRQPRPAPKPAGKKEERQ